MLVSIRRWLVFFMVSLFLSGLTAMPAEMELKWLISIYPAGNPLGDWLARVHEAVATTNRNYPFIAYGYDWLAFAHFVLAILFIGPYKDPVRNKWIIEFAMICCLLVIPFAFIAGQMRGIPLGWRLIDCCFGVIGLIPLGIVLGKVRIMEENQVAVYTNK